MVIDFYFLLYAAYFWVFFSPCFCLFKRQILAVRKRPLSKTKVDSSQTVHMKLKRFGPVCFLNFSNANFTCILSGATGYCFFDREIIFMVIHPLSSPVPINQ